MLPFSALYTDIMKELLMRACVLRLERLIIYRVSQLILPLIIFTTLTSLTLCIPKHINFPMVPDLNRNGPNPFLPPIISNLSKSHNRTHLRSHHLGLVNGNMRRQSSLTATSGSVGLIVSCMAGHLRERAARAKIHTAAVLTAIACLLWNAMLVTDVPPSFAHKNQCK